MGAAERRDPSAHGDDEILLGGGAGQRDHGLDDAERILGPVVDLPGQQVAGVLIGLALGDIPQDHRGKRRAAHLHLGNGGLDGEFLPVGAQAADRPERPHAAVGDAGRLEPGDMLAMAGAMALGHQALDGRADGLRRGDAEHPFGGGIEQHDPLLLVDRDEGVHRRLDDALHSKAAFRQGVLGRFAFGDVAQDHRGQPFAADIDLRDRSLDGEFATVGAQAVDRPQGPHLAGGDAGFGEAMDMLGVGGPVALRNEPGDGFAQGLLRGQAEHALRGGIEQDDPLGVVDGDDPVHGRGHDPFKPAHGFDRVSRSLGRSDGRFHETAPPR